MRYLSVCSGIEAATMAWHTLGWNPVAFSEIEPFPSAVLAHRFPHIPNLGDMTNFKEWPDDLAPDILVGGTPCQSFSVAGLRAGLADPRGSLMLTYLAIAGAYQPRWVVWENVPGVLSSNGGRDFAALLQGLAQLGYGFAYRVLDAQHFGVPQRRRRVFVVGHLGDWRLAAAVLFERHSLQGHPAPSRKAGETVAGTFGSRSTAGGGFGGDFETTGGLQPVYTPTLTSNGDAHSGFRDEHGLVPICMSTGQAGAELGIGIGTTLNCNHEAPIACYGQAVAFGGDIARTLSARHDSGPCADRGMDVVAVALRGRDGGATAELGDEVGNCLRASGGGGDKAHVLAQMQVRRLTPTECERLQGFPDGYTDVPYRNKPAADGPRYKALGNSMAVPVMKWIGERISMVTNS